MRGSPNGKMSEFDPITEDKEILDFIHSLNGDYKHDRAICEARGMPRCVSDVIRRVFGKVKNKKYVHPQEFKDRICEQYRQGVPIKQICSDNGLSTGSVESILSLAGIEKDRNIPWSKIQKMRLVHMREVKKMTWAEIGKYFGKSLSACALQYTYIKGTQPRQRRKKDAS